MVVARILLISLSVFSLQAHSNQLLWDVQVAWKTKIEHPTLLVVCNEKIWSYSRSEKIIWSLNIQTGKKESSEKSRNTVVSFSCFKKQILIGYQDQSITYNNKRFLLPRNGRLKDLQCDETTCYALLDNNLYSTKDFTKWEQNALPPSKAVLDNKIDLKLNPFSNWQDYMVLASSHYSRLKPHSQAIYLLDPMRVKIVEKTKNRFVKWGEWGAWEGSLMNPRAFDFTPGGDLIIVDSDLKAIFLYNTQGKFLATLRTSGELPDFEYPSDIRVTPDHIYVSDVFANQIIAFQWKNLSSNWQPTLIRQNLFRRAQVLKDRFQNRCLKCHDGLVSDEWDKYFKNSHPISQQVKSKNQPLLEDGKTSCVSCHDPHHSNKNKSSKFKAHLRMDEKKLCLECHSSHAERPMNHGGKCTLCHQMHKGYEHLLKTVSTQLCVSCHATKSFKHRNLNTIEDIDVAKLNQLFNHQLNCLTCHSSHNSNQKQSLLNIAEPSIKLCQSCHGEKAQDLYKNFHMRMTANKRRGRQ
ncbi:MAG: cytochrome c3 family protein [Bdellovibrionales bacterium]